MKSKKNKIKTFKFKNRYLARKLAVQAIYSWKISNNDIYEIEAYFISNNNLLDIDIIFFKKIYRGVINNIIYLEMLIKKNLSYNFIKISYIEYSILYIALFEINECHDIPYKVIINEAIKLTKKFSHEKSYKFINGILESITLKLNILKLISILKKIKY